MALDVYKATRNRYKLNTLQVPICKLYVSSLVVWEFVKFSSQTDIFTNKTGKITKFASVVFGTLRFSENNMLFFEMCFLWFEIIMRWVTKIMTCQVSFSEIKFYSSFLCLITILFLLLVATIRDFRETKKWPSAIFLFAWVMTKKRFQENFTISNQIQT